MHPQLPRPQAQLFLDADWAHIDHAALVCETRRLRAKAVSDTLGALCRLFKLRSVRHLLTRHRHT